MASPRPKTTENSVSITGIEFYVDKQTYRGRAKIEFDQTILGSVFPSKEIEVTLIAIWQNPHTDNAVKAHFIANRGDIMHRDFIRACTGRGYLRCDKPEMQLLAGQNGVFRYGVDSRVNPAFAGVDYTEGYDPYWIYDSKALAFKAIMAAVEGSGVAIGGLQDVNFSLFPNAMLRSLGFQEVPDLLRRSESMWIGNPSKVFSSGDYEGPGKVEKSIKEFVQMIDQFLVDSSK